MPSKRKKGGSPPSLRSLLPGLDSAPTSETKLRAAKRLAAIRRAKKKSATAVKKSATEQAERTKVRKGEKLTGYSRKEVQETGDRVRAEADAAKQKPEDKDKKKKKSKVKEALDKISRAMKYGLEG